MTKRKLIAFAVSLLLTLCGIAVAQQQGIGWHFDMMRMDRVSKDNTPYSLEDLWARITFNNGDVLDWTTNGNNGTVVNGGLVYSSGIATFTNKPHIAMPVTNNAPTTNGTILIKVKPYTLNSADVWMSHKTTRDIWLETLNGTSMRWGGTGSNPMLLVLPSQSNIWNLIGMSWKSNEFYFVVSTNGGSSWSMESDLIGTVVGSLTTFRIGDYYSGGYPVSGECDEYRIHTRAFTTNEMMIALPQLGNQP